MMIDFLLTFLYMLMFVGEPIYDTGFIMRFRIVEKYNGENYYYIIQQLWFGLWTKPSDHYLRVDFHTCKCCEQAIDDYGLKITTNNIILEKTIED